MVCACILWIVCLLKRNNDAHLIVIMPDIELSYLRCISPTLLCNAVRKHAAVIGFIACITHALPLLHEYAVQ